MDFEHIKSLDALNDEFLKERAGKVTHDRRARPERKKRGAVRLVSDAIFFTGIVVVLVSLLTLSSRDNGPRMIFGYTYMTVLTPSMQSVIPKGSLVFVKHTEAGKINVGDDITYMKDATNSITHRVIEILDEPGQERGYRTQGVNNINPDPGVVYESNVVGKVLFHVPVLGAALMYLAENVFVVFVMYGLAMLLSFSLRALLADKRKAGGPKKDRRILPDKEVAPGAVLTIQ